jgi:indole-3-glycerol phosphate synthase
MSTVLDKICNDKRTHVSRKKAIMPHADMVSMASDAPPVRGFIKSLRAKAPGPALIAEVKKASPSKGIIRADFDPVEIAKTYEENGAACLSVLTDEPYFMGCDDYLLSVRPAVSIPVLRKDFMVDAYQIYESRALGADCVLLIMAALSDSEAKEFFDIATSLSMDTLFEVHDDMELERALSLSPQMVGVNNRNLKTLEVSLETGLALSRKMPKGILKVAESGIENRESLQAFHAQGFEAFLIGESLMKSPDIGAATRAILTTIDTEQEQV